MNNSQNTWWSHLNIQQVVGFAQCKHDLAQTARKINSLEYCVWPPYCCWFANAPLRCSSIRLRTFTDGLQSVSLHWGQSSVSQPSGWSSLLSVLVVWYSDVRLVVAAVVRRVEEVGRLRRQAGAQGFMGAQHGGQILGLLRQLLHLLPQGGILLLQVLTLLENKNRDIWRDWNRKQYFFVFEKSLNEKLIHTHMYTHKYMVMYLYI